MALSPGTRLGPYEIVDLVGAGGMGEVYRAQDTRLDRTVAIKVLPQDLSENTGLRQRLEQEARAISSLNHPHICTLHDIGRHEGIDFLVMEYVDGETLADRLEKGPLPLEQALTYAVQISDALDKAHRRGVVHRDLKPGNIITTKSGAKLLDFGLAKLLQGDAKEPDLSAVTEQKPLTKEGTILGTFQYMAPEQLEGREADARTDIFAFGALLYEMITGKKAFEGKSQASLIHAIMGVDPPLLTNVQPMSPPSLERIVQTCLAKDPDDRWQSARDVTRELQWITEEPAPERAAPNANTPRLVWGLLGLAAGVLSMFLLGLALRPDEAKLPTTRFRIRPESMNVSIYSSIALSPDGRTVAYLSEDERSTRLYRRSLDELESTEIHADESIRTVFFSPDGEWIGFVVGEENATLQKIPANGGRAVTIARGNIGITANWTESDTIIFNVRGLGLMEVSASGGEPEVLVKEGADGALWGAESLPGDKAILFTAFEQGVSVMSRDTGEQKFVFDGWSAKYAAGHLVYQSEESLWSVPFDVDRLEVKGAPALIAESVERNFTVVHFALADDGTLAYVPADLDAAQNLVWVDRGGEREFVNDTMGRFAGWARFSPDETRLALEGISNDGADVWTYDIQRGTKTRLTRDGRSIDPVWSPDGDAVVFSKGSGDESIYWARADGGAPPEALVTSDGARLRVTSWSPDGQTLTLDALHTGDIWVAPLDGGEPTPFVETNADEWGARFSPEGDHIAYVSDVSGRDEIYVQPYPGPGERWTVSTSGGREPVWSKDGRELFYRNRDQLMAVDVSREPEFRIGAPRLVFEGSFETSTSGTYYDVNNDGTRFIMLERAATSSSDRHIVVVMNWIDELGSDER